jgi:hypothetical protein
LIRSKNTSPGSPLRHAFSTIWRNTVRARRFPADLRVRGLTSSYSSSRSTACMKRSVTATLMLKFCSATMSPFTLTNASISGCSTLRIAMFAPRRVPPCLIDSVAASYTRMNETGPLAMPPVLATMSPAGRRRLNANPVPPPDWWMSAVFLSVSKMPIIESSTGSTKHAELLHGRPALPSVGEFGRNRNDVISS